MNRLDPFESDSSFICTILSIQEFEIVRVLIPNFGDILEHV